MNILWGFLQIMIGVLCIWMGAFNMITAMVPKQIGIKFAEASGAWMRENVFRLPPLNEDR